MKFNKKNGLNGLSLVKIDGEWEAKLYGITLTFGHSTARDCIAAL
jgi:hypothetical protein